MLLEGKAGSVGELLAEVGRITAEFRGDYRAPEEIWFRGQAKVIDPLLPHLYSAASGEYHYDEANLMNRFQVYATPLVQHRPASDWEWYFLARHHGLPTRLLDWSESLLAAAYFALNSHLPSNRLALDDQLQEPVARPCYEDTCPTIWILDAGTLNDVAVNSDSVIVPGGPKSAGYLPDALADDRTDGNARPIAILPPRANDRIVAQQGTFTIHGHDKASIDSLATVEHRIKLARIVLDRSRLIHLWNELETLGVHPLTFFPDLDNVARHVCWACQSAV